MVKLSSLVPLLGVTGVLLLGASTKLQAQTGIGTRTPDGSAALDISSSNRGLLIPRVSLQSLSDASTVPNPATSLLVYNTNSNLAGGPGYYYNAGSSGAPNWTQLVGSTTPVNLRFWSLTGNSGTNPANNFLGTTDAQDLAFRVGNVERMRLFQSGGLGLGNTTLNNLLVGFGISGATTGTNNSVMGINAGQSLTGGNDNTFIGYQAGRDNQNNTRNTFLGSIAGFQTSGGNNNTFLGYNAGGNNITGGGNVYLGANATATGSSGDNNILIGNGATNIGSLTNSVAIGAGASVGQSNAIVLGNNASVGIGTPTPTATLHVAGSSSTIRFDALGNSTGTQLVTVGPSGQLSTTALIGSAGDFIANSNSSGAQQANASFNIAGTGIIAQRLGVGQSVNPPAATLDVTGDGILRGNFTTQGNATFQGTLGVAGTITATGLNGITGDNGTRLVSIDNNGNLTTRSIPGAINTANFIANSPSLQTGANFNIGGNGTVVGQFTAGSARITGLSANTSPTALLVTDNSGNLGSFPVSAIPTATNFIANNPSSQQTGANFNIGGNGIIGGTLTAGATTLGNTQVNGTLGVTGASTLGALTAGTTTLGATTLNSATITGLGGNGANRIVVSDNAGALTTTTFGTLAGTQFINNQNSTTQSGDFNISGSGTVGTLTVSQGTTLNGATAVNNSLAVNNNSLSVNNGNLTVGGTATLGASGSGNTSLVVNGNTRITGLTGGLVQAGSDGTLSIAPASTLSGQFINNGTGAQSGNFNITGTGTVGTLSVTNAASVGQALTVGGLTTIGTPSNNQNLVVNGNETVTGTSSPAALNVTSTTTGSRIASLGGSGNRLVTTDNNGNLSTTAAPPSGINNSAASPSTVQTAASFNIDGSGTLGGNLSVGGTSTLNGNTTIGSSGNNQNLTVNGNAIISSLTNATVPTTLPNLVAVTSTGQLQAISSNFISNGFILNQTTQQPSSNFNITGIGRVGNSVIVGNNSNDNANVVIAAGGITAPAGIGAAGPLRIGSAVPPAGTNAIITGDTRINGNMSVGTVDPDDFPSLPSGLVVGGNIIPASAAGTAQLGDPTSGVSAATPAGRIWGTTNSLNLNVGLPITATGASADANTNRVRINGNVRPGFDLASNLGSSSFRWNNVFAGTVTATTVSQTSDARLKTNITNLGYGMSTVMGLRPVRYAWRTSPSQTNKIGFLAQEVQKVVPEVVYGSTQGKEHLSVSYAELVPVLVKALQEQQAQLDAMKSRAAQAEGRAEKAEAALQSFEARLRALEAGAAGSGAGATAQGQR